MLTLTTVLHLRVFSHEFLFWGNSNWKVSLKSYRICFGQDEAKKLKRIFLQFDIFHFFRWIELAVVKKSLLTYIILTRDDSLFCWLNTAAFILSHLPFWALQYFQCCLISSRKSFLSVVMRSAKRMIRTWFCLHRKVQRCISLGELWIFANFARRVLMGTHLQLQIFKEWELVWHAPRNICVILLKRISAGNMPFLWQHRSVDLGKGERRDERTYRSDEACFRKLGRGIFPNL